MISLTIKCHGCFDAFSGSENSPIGIGNSVLVASTYGYAYPSAGLPADAGTSVPPTAPFIGGLVRVDLDLTAPATPNGWCRQTWYQRNIASSAVPKLSVADGNLYTITMELSGAITRDDYYYTVVGFSNGQTVKRCDGVIGMYQCMGISCCRQQMYQLLS